MNKEDRDRALKAYKDSRISQTNYRVIKSKTEQDDTDALFGDIEKLYIP